MTLKPRTIDDLGIEASKQYAKNQRELDPRIIEESKFFQTQPAIETVVTPYIPPEHVEGFSIGSMAVWAGFSPPIDYSVSASRLYTYQMFPKLGGSDELQDVYDRFETVKQRVPQEKKQQYEYRTLHSLLEFLISFSRTFDLIRARCNQYQRG